MTKKSRQKLKYFGNAKNFENELKSIFLNFERAFNEASNTSFFWEVRARLQEEAIGAINEAAIIAPRNPLSCFFILCFTVSVALSINRLDFSSNFTNLTISSMSSSETNKVNSFPALTNTCPLIFSFKCI